MEKTMTLTMTTDEYSAWVAFELTVKLLVPNVYKGAQDAYLAALRTKRDAAATAAFGEKG